jgi:hypothetical protein
VIAATARTVTKIGHGKKCLDIWILTRTHDSDQVGASLREFPGIPQVLSKLTVRSARATL